MTIEPIANGESGHSVRLKLNELIGNHYTNAQGAALEDNVAQQIADVIERAQAAENAAEAAGTQAVQANETATTLRNEFDSLTVDFTGSLLDALDAIQAEAQAQLDNVAQQVNTDLAAVQSQVNTDLAAVQSQISTDLSAIASDLAAVEGDIVQIQVDQAALDAVVSNGLAQVNSDIAGLRTEINIDDLRIFKEEDATDRVLELLAGLKMELAFTDKKVRDAGIYVDPANGTVKIRALESTSERVSQAEIDINGVKSEVALKASVTYVNTAISNALLDPSQIPIVDELSLRVTAAEVRLDGQDALIELKADALTVNGIEVRLNQAEVDIDALGAAIALRVTTAEFQAAESRLTAAEIVLNALDVPSITATVTDQRGLDESFDASAFSSLGALLGGYRDRQNTREAFASAQQQLRAVVDENYAAESSARLTLAALVDDTRATLQVEQIARATADEAISVQLTNLDASVTGVSSSLSANYYTKAQTDAATAAATLALKSEMEGAGGSIGLLSATLSQDYYTKVAVDLQLAQASTTLTSGYEGAIEDETAFRNLANLLQAYDAIKGQRQALAFAQQQIRTVVDEGFSAEATARTQLAALLDNTRATLEVNYYTRSQTDSAISTATLALEAELTGPDGIVSLLEASLEQNYYTKAATDFAIATATLALKSQMEGPTGSIGQLSANLTQNYYTKTAADLATAAATLALKSQMEGAGGSIGQLSANLSQNYYTKTAADTATAAATTALKSQMEGAGGSIGQLSANLSQNYYTKTATDSAISTATTTLKSQMEGAGGSIGQLSANLSQNYYTKTAADTATAAATTALKSQMEGSTGSIGQLSANLSQNYYTKTAADVAMAAATATLKSQMEGAGGSIGQLSATLTQNYYTKTATDTAISAAFTTLESTINGVGANVASLSANLSQNYYTKTAADTAISAANTSLRSQMEGSTGSIGLLSANLSQNYYTKTAANTAISNATTTLKSQMEGPTGSIGQLSATLSQNYYTKAATDSVVAGAVTTINTSIGDLNGDITDVRALRLNNLNGTSFGTLLQNLGVASNGTSAFVTNVGTAISDLQGNASAGYLIKAQAGNAVSLLDLIAADGSGAPVSIAKISAQDILLEGSVAASQLVVTDFSGNLVPNPAFIFGDLRGWSGVPSSFSVVAKGGTHSAQQGSPTKNMLRIETDTGTTRSAMLASFPVEGGQTFRSRYQYATGGSSRDVSLSLRFAWYDADDVQISISTVAVASNASNTSWVTSPLGQAVAPTGAARVEVSMRRLSGGAGNAYLTNFEIIRQRTGSTLLTPNSITTDLVTTDDFVAWSTALFGGLMASTNYVSGESGWRINVNGDAEFGTLALRKNAITVPVRSYSPDFVDVTSDSSWTTVALIKVRRTGVATEFMFTCSLDGYGSGSAQFRLLRGTNNVVRSASAVTGERGRQAQVAFAMIDWDEGTGMTTYRIQCKKSDPNVTAGWNANLRVFRRYFSAIQFRR
ncbi:hypothetical protein IQ03_02463 [Gemmobacter caeni]|uniref:Uncharacterized protein n=1 Tax=Gemmobacter caeni TaxID=589035 RepID=A0A2T6AZ22_9RHOB|nr:hypothetical protein [Gemmobacter caeni]PTX49062.1 hypothetical protein C8N34_108172 [Gemmobacter caeni]TWI98937.1 hypothetical protein IQ03_02463 [Gemmobacter caeni]